MQVKLIKESKEEIQLELDNLTIAELLRNALWEDKATALAVWHREHPTKNPILVLKTNGKNARKVLLATIEKLQKTSSKLMDEFKKAIK